MGYSFKLLQVTRILLLITYCPPPLLVDVDVVLSFSTPPPPPPPPPTTTIGYYQRRGQGGLSSSCITTTATNQRRVLLSSSLSSLSRLYAAEDVGATTTRTISSSSTDSSSDGVVDGIVSSSSTTDEDTTVDEGEVGALDPEKTTTTTKTTKKSQQQMLPDMIAYSNGYKTVYEEIPCSYCIPSYGSIPFDLTPGTYYRSGPAMYSAGSIIPPKLSIVQPKQPPVPDGIDKERMVLHPFEGDGAMLAITFHNHNNNDGNNNNDDADADDTDTDVTVSDNVGGVTARYRFIRTTAFTNERKKGQRLYKGMDTTRSTGMNADSDNNSNGNVIGNDLLLPYYRHHLQTGLNKNRKNTANTRAMYWSNRLFSMWEGGRPYKLDSISLQTEGPSQLGGAIRKETDPFGGKIVVDPSKKHALFHSVNPYVSKSELTLYEFDNQFQLINNNDDDNNDENSNNIDGRRTVEIPGFYIPTDFCATQRYAIFIQPDITANNIQFIMNKEPGKTLTLGNNPGILHLISRVGTASSTKDDDGFLKTIQLPIDETGIMSDANVHFCNAYDDDDGKVIIDVIRSEKRARRSSSRSKSSSSSSSSSTSWPWCTTLEDYQSKTTKRTLWRYTVDTTTTTTQMKIEKIEQLWDAHCFFGIVNPAVSCSKHRYIYMTVGGLLSDSSSGKDDHVVSPQQGIARYDCTTRTQDIWIPQSYEFCGEPMYVPSTKQQQQRRKDDSNDDDDEDSGYILSVLYNGKKEESELIILRANDISSGPITRIPLGIAIPHGLFGCYATTSSNIDDNSNNNMITYDIIERRSKLFNKIESQGNMWNEVKSDFSGLGLRFDDMEEYFGDFFT